MESETLREDKNGKRDTKRKWKLKARHLEKIRMKSETLREDKNGKWDTKRR